MSEATIQLLALANDLGNDDNNVLKAVAGAIKTIVRQDVAALEAELEAMERPIRELRQRYANSARPWSQIVNYDWVYFQGIIERLLAAQQEKE